MSAPHDHYNERTVNRRRRLVRLSLLSACFVRQHYLDFLNREPDAPGLAFWVGASSRAGRSSAAT
jgi:hypothetical protein